MLVPQGLPEAAVHGLFQPLQLADSPLYPGVAQKAPQAVFAAIPEPLIHAAFQIPGFPGVGEHGASKEPHRLPLEPAEKLLPQGLLGAPCIVPGHALQQPCQHPPVILPVVPAEPGAGDPAGGQSLHRLHHRLRGKGFRLFQPGNGFVPPNPRGILQQRRGQLIIHHKVPHPVLQVREDESVQGNIVPAEAQECLIPRLRVRNAYTVKQFIDIKKGKGVAGFLHLPPAKPGTPGKVPPQLPVRQGLVGGIIVDHSAGEGIIVLIIFQKPCLLEKHRLPGLPGLSRGILQRAGSLQQGRQLLPGSLGPGAQRLLPEDAFKKPLGCILPWIPAHSPHPFRPFVCVNHTIFPLRRQEAVGIP